MTLVQRHARLQLVMFDLLERDENPPLAERLFNAALGSLIAVNVLAVVLHSVPEYRAAYGPYFTLLEVISLMVFGLEYLARLWVAPLHPNYRHPVWGRVRWALTPLALVDLLVLVSFLGGVTGLLALRVLRALKLLSLLKLGRYSEGLRLIGRAVERRRDELLVVLAVVAALVVLAATLMFHVENAANPDSFRSIPHAMWWAIVTLTTVGYGDIYPITPLGKLLGGLIALFGVGLVALPAGLIATGFSEELARQRERPRCPHCGEELHD